MHRFISFPPHMGHLHISKSLQSTVNSRNNVKYGHRGTSRTPTSQEKSTASSKALASTSNGPNGSVVSCLMRDPMFDLVNGLMANFFFFPTRNKIELGWMLTALS